MVKSDVVIDTNVLVVASAFAGGIWHFHLACIDSARLGYEAALKRGITSLSAEEIDDVVDFLCSRAVLNKIFYLWRPILKDPDDDFVLELAVKANAAIVTWNVSDFKLAAQFGIAVLTHREFLASLEVQP